MTDPALRTAMFLTDHPAWTPDDLERADPDVVGLMVDIGSAIARAQKGT